jgi:intracellular sulfur oxidation DsrE/DsrF family protein
VIAAAPDAQVELVFYGKSMDMINKDKSTVADAITKLSEKKNVAFRVCEVALRNNHLEKSELVAGVGTVPDGIYEIISKQAAGWGYIKVSH